MAKRKSELSLIHQAKPTIIRKSNNITKLGNIYQNISQIRIMMRILEAIQPDLEKFSKGSSMNQLDLFDENPFESLVVVLPFKKLTEHSSNYNQIVDALNEMQKIIINVAGVGGKLSIGLLSGVYITDEKEAYLKTVTVRIQKDIALMLLDISKGYTKINPEIPFNTGSMHTALMYMLICRWADLGVFHMPYQEFRDFFSLGDKYVEFFDVKRFVIQKAKKELDKISDISFDLLDPQKKEGKITHIRLKIYSKKAIENQNKVLEMRREQAIGFLKKTFRCEEKHLGKINSILFTSEEKIMTKLLTVILEVEGYLQDGKIKEVYSKPDYIIGAILKAFPDLKEKKETIKH